MRLFHTYVHKRPDGTPFYVGKGSRDRANNFSARNIFHKRIVSKHGRANILIQIVKRNLTEQQAFEHEKILIECLRDFDYRLCNMTDGGEGTCGHITSEETKAKLRITSARYRHTPEAKKKISILAKGRKRKETTEEWRKNLSAALLGHHKTDEHKKKLSLIVKTPEWREKLRQANLGKKHTEEHKMKISEGLRKWRARIKR